MRRSPCTQPRRPHERPIAHRGPDRSTRIRHPTESPSTCATRLNEAEDAIVVSEYDQGSDASVTSIGCAVEIRVGDLPATAEAPEHLIGHVLRIDLYDGGGNSARSGRIGDRRIQVSNRVHAITDDRDHTRGRPQAAIACRIFGSCFAAWASCSYKYLSIGMTYGLTRCRLSAGIKARLRS